MTILKKMEELILKVMEVNKRKRKEDRWTTVRKPKSKSETLERIQERRVEKKR